MLREEIRGVHRDLIHPASEIRRLSELNLKNMKKKNLVEKAQALYPNNRVEESRDTNSAPYVYFTEEDMVAGPTSTAKKYKLHKGVVWRNLKQGYFRPWYQKFDASRKKGNLTLQTKRPGRKLVAQPSNWAMQNAPLIVKAAKLAIKKICFRRFGGAISQSDDLVSETVYHMLCVSSGWKRVNHNSDWGMAYREAFNSADYAFGKIFRTRGYGMGEKSMSFLIFDSLDEEIKEMREDKILTDNHASEESLFLHEMINNIRQAIVDTYGQKAWEMVWRWAQGPKDVIPERVKQIIGSVSLN
ncbi:MAG: hypothetical protein KBC17_03405 [Candidatus Pacebacteria bacterium]|nr:hypothetical protein [Candidatus Paceibacterota bacterium]